MQLISISILMPLVFLWSMTTSGQENCEITIFMIGDSTMADKPFSGSNPEKGWGQIFPLYLKEGITVENHAVNGRSTKSFRDEGRWTAVQERISPGDYVIIQFGHNDQKVESPERYAAAGTDYKNNLIRYILEARAKGAKPIIATSISRRSYDEAGALEDTHGQYSEVVRQVALEHNVPLLDLHKRTVGVIKQFGVEKSKELFLHYKPGDYDKFPKGVADNTHLSPSGAFKVADLVVEELRKEVPEIAVFFKD